MKEAPRFPVGTIVREIDRQTAATQMACRNLSIFDDDDRWNRMIARLRADDGAVSSEDKAGDGRYF